MTKRYADQVRSHPHTDRDNSLKTLLCRHRAPLDTHERFVRFLIEHYASNFTLWLAPDQVCVITLNEDEVLINCANSIVAELRANRARARRHHSVNLGAGLWLQASGPAV